MKHIKSVKEISKKLKTEEVAGVVIYRLEDFLEEVRVFFNPFRYDFLAQKADINYGTFIKFMAKEHYPSFKTLNKIGALYLDLKRKPLEKDHYAWKR